MRKRFRRFQLERRESKFKKAWRTDRNIHAVAPNELTGKVVVYVEKLPEAVTAYGLDNNVEYIEIPGGFKAYVSPPPHGIYYMRPVLGGASVANVNITAGTATLKVRDKATGKPVILSNYHVLAMDDHGRQQSAGTVVTQPGPYDMIAGDNPNDLKIGELLRWVKVGENITNYVDCAIAELMPPDVMDLPINHQGYVTALGEAYIGEQVRKDGRSTGWEQRGTVSSTSASVTVGYPINKVCNFEDVIFISNNPVKDFSSPGDSGSAVLDFSSNNLIGLLFAGGGGTTIVCKAQKVFDALNIELIPPPDITRTLMLDMSKWQGEIPLSFSIISDGISYEAYDQNALEMAFDAGIYKVNSPDYTIQSFMDIKARGVSQVLLKASQGTTIKDAKFDEYYDYARQVGLGVGGYHFNEPSKPAADQVNWFKQCVGSRTIDFAMLDTEITQSQSAQRITDVTLGALNLITKWITRPCLNYTSPSFANTYFINSSAWEAYPLDIAFWSKTAMFPLIPNCYPSKKWASWQHEVNNNGAWFGVGSKSIDVNTTNWSIFKNLLPDGTPPPPPPNTYVLSVSVVGNGSVALDPAGGIYDPDTNVNLTATAGSGWSFSAWSGDLSGATNPATVTMSSNKSITATFIQDVPPPSSKTPYTTYRAKVVAAVVTCRNAPNTAGVRWFSIYQNDTVDVLEEINRGAEDIWARIGKNQYCAIRYQGKTYLEYV